jgi:hypothetical protein
MRDCLFLYWCRRGITLFGNCLQKRLYELEISERHLFLSPIVISAAGDKGFFLTTWALGMVTIIAVVVAVMKSRKGPWGRKARKN